MDHELIFLRLARLKSLWLALAADSEADRSVLSAEIRLLREFMDIHHHIEETLLFPALKPYFSRVQNGPNCSLYMTNQIMFPPIAGAEKAARNLRQEPRLNQERVREIENHNRIGSFLSIPLEEHEAGVVYSELLLEVLAPGQLEYPCAEITLAVHSYLSLIHQHASKEDNCLFPQCEDLAVAMNIKIEVPNATETKWKIERQAFLYEILPEGVKSG